MSSPGPASRLGDWPFVRELAAWYRAAFHAHLTVGRAIAAQAPRVAPLEHKWLVVSCAYCFVTLAEAWERRLDELTFPLKLSGSPAPAVTVFAERLCRLDWPEALDEAGACAAAWMHEISSITISGETHFQDVRILRRARDDLVELVGQFRAGGYGSVDHGAEVCRSHFVNDEAAGAGEGTPALPVRPVPVRAYPPGSILVSEYAPPAPEPAASETASLDAMYAASLHNTLQIEFISIDIPLRNAAEYSGMPVAFYVDMVRHAHDEMRHTRMLEENLRRYGARIGDFPFVVPDRYELLIEQDLIYRLVILSRTGESEAIELLSNMIPALREAGENELARMWDYVLADEVRHTLFGNRWLRFLVGDDAAMDRATQDSIARYNQAIAAGRLSRPPRPIDYLTSPGLPIEAELRDLAGFSEGEIGMLASARGAQQSQLRA